MINISNIVKIYSIHSKGVEDLVKISYDVHVNINDNFKRGDGFMKNNQILKSTAKGIKSVLNMTLRSEANSTSCIIMYEPKAPKELVKFRRNK